MSRRNLSRGRPRPTEELLQELISTLGWGPAHALLDKEAEGLRTSDTRAPHVIRSAYATFRSAADRNVEQESLL